MSTTQTEAPTREVTTEQIIGEIEEAETHTHQAKRHTEAGEFHKALEELTSAVQRIEWASGLVKEAMRR